MASQGPLSGGTFANDASIGTENWTNPSNAASSNNSRATFTTGGLAIPYVSRYLKATNFGFSIPSGATIDGIVVEIEGLEDDASFNFFDEAVRIVKGGTIGSTDKSSGTEWPTTEAYRTYGASNDLWGETWSDSDINNSGFGVAFAAEGGGGFLTMHIDHIRITVYYTEGGGATALPQMMHEYGLTGGCL